MLEVSQGYMVKTDLKKQTNKNPKPFLKCFDGVYHLSAVLMVALSLKSSLVLVK